MKQLPMQLDMIHPIYNAVRSDIKLIQHYIVHRSLSIGYFLNNKSIVHPLVNILKLGFTDANMLEPMHWDTNANLYPTHTFLNWCLKLMFVR